MIQIDGMLLMRLRDCAASTKLGMVDQIPSLKRLAQFGLVKAVEKGHQVTPEGFAFLREPEIVNRLKRL